MLTNFFGKSNPINFVVCGVYLLVALFFSLYAELTASFFGLILLKKTGLFLLLLFSLLLLDFVIRKNSLTQVNTYSICLFSCLIAMLPSIFSEENIVTSVVFVLLALRRIASLPSERNIEKKLFDASFYISIAALFHFWSVLFLILLYWAITKISVKSFRMLFIPITGIMAALLFSVVYHLLVHNSLAWYAHWIPTLSLDFSAYNQATLLIPSAIIGALIVWIIVIRMIRVTTIQRKQQRNYKLITFMLIISLAVTLLSEEKSGAELLFLLSPLAIVTTNYFERKLDFWFQEVLLWVFMALPFGLFFFFGIP